MFLLSFKCFKKKKRNKQLEPVGSVGPQVGGEPA